MQSSDKDDLDRRYEELDRIVQGQWEEFDQERSLKRERRGEFAFQVAAQALGTTLGAGIVALAAVLLGVLDDIDSRALGTIISVVLVGSSALIVAIRFGPIRPISEEHAEYIKLRSQKRLRELGEKMARGEELTDEESSFVIDANTWRDLHFRKKRKM